MKKRTGLVYLLMAVLVSFFLTAGCAKKPAPAPVPPPTAEAPAPAKPAEVPGGVQEERIAEAPIAERPISEPAAPAPAAVPELQRIFFDYDQYVLTPQAQQTLADNAAFMKARSGVSVVVEGHCDERGSDEYNLALGERRARAARDFLISLGIAPDRLSVISYGEERPLEPASNEAAWSKNRRAEFKIR